MRPRAGRPGTFMVAAALLLPGVPLRAQGDARAAAEQYRVARRLAAERSAQAAPSLRKVLELDPRGPLADDALLDLADLAGLPRWPEELGRISPDAARQALEIVSELLRDHATGDRAAEAGVCRALLELEPQPHRDPAAARVELLAAATRPDDDPWAARARYVLGWLDEVEGRHERAAGRYHRLLLDSETDPAAVRAAVGLGRIAMREGRFDHAAAWLEQAVEREAPDETRALGLRELAVRGVLRAAGGGRAWPAAARTVETEVRGAEDLAALPDGGWLVADRKTETVTRFGLDGTPGRRWELDGVVSVAVDPFGRAYAAAGQGVFRLTEDRADLLAGTGELGPLCCLAVDGAGAVWMADRRGARLARLQPAAARSEVILESREVKLGDLVWDGRRIVATDLRTGRLLAIGPDGAAETLSSLGSARPLALAADAAGQVAVLDAKVPEVVLIGPDGTIRERLSTAALGATRPGAVSLGEDGSLHLLDEATGALVSIP